MTGDGGQGYEAGADVVEQDGRRFAPLNWRPPRRGAAMLLAVGLITGLALGYAAGDRHATGSASPARSASPVPASPAPALPAPSLAAGTTVLTQGIGTCAVQDGRDLQLGVQVTNQSTADVTLGLVHPVLPLGGLKWISQQWAPCSALPFGQDPALLTPGASTWFSVTFEVLAGCPGPLPVQFTVGYTYQGQPGTASLPGFPDLSQVPYTGCDEATIRAARG